MSAGRTLGLLGGTFDPVHVGHLDTAEAARRALALDDVLLIPSHAPPHRPVEPRASAFHRFAMAALAVDGHPHYRVSDLEVGRQGPSYSIDTLRALHEQGWPPGRLFFVLGSDAFADLASWRGYPAVLDAAHFVIIARPGTSLESALARQSEARARLRQPGVMAADPCTTTGVFVVEARTRDVSSTTVRARIAARQPIDDLVPPAVARHIVAHQLYGAVDDSHGEDQDPR